MAPQEDLGSKDKGELVASQSRPPPKNRPTKEQMMSYVLKHAPEAKQSGGL